MHGQLMLSTNARRILWHLISFTVVRIFAELWGAVLSLSFLSSFLGLQKVPSHAHLQPRLVHLRVTPWVSFFEIKSFLNNGRRPRQLSRCVAHMSSCLLLRIALLQTPRSSAAPAGFWWFPWLSRLLPNRNQKHAVWDAFGCHSCCARCAWRSARVPGKQNIHLPGTRGSAVYTTLEEGVQHFLLLKELVAGCGLAQFQGAGRTAK